MSRLGRYEVGEQIGTGGMGTVFRARDAETGTEVALKRMLAPDHRAAFEIEARLLSDLSHPRVVRIVDHFAAPDGAYVIVMELVAGTDLARVLWDSRTPGIPAASAVAWTCEACEALAYVHEQQVVHGDVKPRNLLLGPDGVVLGDFGVAARLHDGAALGPTGGTPRYMAPEVFAGDPPSQVSDVYGVSASLWTLLTRVPPAYGEDAPLADIVPGVTADLAETLLHGLAFDPADRIASAEELASALGRPLAERRGVPLAASLDRPGLPRTLVESVVRTAAGVFEAAAASIALVDPPTGDLVYVAAWGAGAHGIVGQRLPAGEGIAGAVVAAGEPQAVPDCRSDLRFAGHVAMGTGYVPYTLLVVPLRRGEEVIGALSVLDRRDGSAYLPSDIPRATLFAELAVAALEASG